jgi:hypothetical protein
VPNNFSQTRNSPTSTEPDAYQQALQVIFSFQDLLLNFLLTIFTSPVLPHFPTLTLCDHLKVCGLLTVGIAGSYFAECDQPRGLVVRVSDY